MLPREALRQIRRLHLKARRATEDILGGEYHSVFKGTGLAFDEVREYLPGDDVRAIDWNVTARMGHPYLKRYTEERELTVVLAVDLSGSQAFGAQGLTKREVVAELAAVLAFSALANNDKVGLLAFTDRVERFVPPAKGTRHLLRLIRDVLTLQPDHAGTDLARALDTLNRVLHRRVIVFLLSDFRDRDFERALRRTARRHELIALRVADPREETLPPVGLADVADPETGQTGTLDTGQAQVRAGYAQAAAARAEAAKQAAQGAGIDLVEVGTDGRHLDRLAACFRQRERRLRHS